MKPKENNLEKNISRLVKLAGDSSKPGKVFTDSLTNDALSKLKQPIWVRIASFRRPTWIGAAAAVLVIGLLLMVPQFTKDKSAKFAKEPSRTAEKRMEFTIAEKEVDSRFRGNDEARAAIAETAIPEQPPFAPASAIELVTLPRRDKVQLTIYNSADLTLVRERRNLTVKKGWNWLQFMWANTLIDPTSLSLEPLNQADKIDIQQLVFPARLKDIGRWLIRSQTQGQVPFEITYFTSGLSWRAFYMGTLSADEQKMNLQGYVRVTNKSGEDYENAQTRLIVGKVHQLDKIAELARRRYPYNSPQDRRDIKSDKSVSSVEKYFYDADSVAVGDKLERMNRKEIKKEGLSEYFLYTIEGTETIADGWGKRLMSFEAEDIAVKSLYKYDRQRWGDATVRFVAFANDRKHNLGDTPIPNGSVKIYSLADEQGHLSYVGGTGIKYIPVDEEVELNLGPAQLVSVEPILMDFKMDNFTFDKKKNIAGWDEIRSWKVEVTNTRNLPVEVEITRGFGTAYWSLEYDGQDVSYKKHDATHARFKTKLQPQSKRTFIYTVTTYHGRREEQANQ